MTYLKEITSNLTKSNTQKIQLKIAINFILFKDNDKDRVIHK